jgi:dTMP kinase
MKGFIISIEGGEGSGKGTVIKKLKEMFPDFVFTREPGGCKIAEEIRSVIVDKENVGMTPITEAMLFAAARNQHLVDKVIPALNDGKIVVFDRYYDSSLVYQGVARGLGMNAVYEVNQMAIRGRMPDMTIYLDIDPVVALNRIAQNNRETNRIDLESLDFHQKIRAGYLDLAEMHPNRVRIVNANQIPEDVFADVVKLIEERTVNV